MRKAAAVCFAFAGIESVKIMAIKMRGRLSPKGGAVCLALFGLLTALVRRHATDRLDQLWLSMGPPSRAVKKPCRAVGPCRVGPKRLCGRLRPLRDRENDFYPSAHLLWLLLCWCRLPASRAATLKIVRPCGITVSIPTYPVGIFN